MGRIIDLQKFRDHIADLKQRTSSTKDLSTALSGCMVVRRQIGSILELTIAIEELIDRHADPKSRHEMLERLWVSRQHFMTAFERVSATIDVLSKMTSDHQATPSPDASS